MPGGCRCSGCTSTSGRQTQARWSRGASCGSAASSGSSTALGLEARADVASDPFFGRGGTLLADSQRDQRLKLEIVAPIASDEHPTAIISLNYHQDHFGALFGITTADGAVAHTSCVGFGLERLTLALYRRHGFTRAHLAVAGARGAGALMRRR